MAALVVFDQFSKFLVVRHIRLFESVTVVPGFFRLWHVQNYGAVWGFFSEHGPSLVSLVITAVAVLALAVVAGLFYRADGQFRGELTAYALMLGGAAGNIADRIRLGYVTDFLDVFVRQSHWPTFNVADSCICIGVGLLAIAMWRGKCTRF
jgi:signal peptidase II